MSRVFETALLGPLTVKNRVVRSATHEGMGDAEGAPTDDLERMYERLAAGGVGTIVTGYVGVDRRGRATPTMRMFDDDRYVDIYRPIVARAKAHDVTIIQQIAHGGAHAAAHLDGVELVAPSRYRIQPSGTVARELREEEIDAIIDQFVAAIVRTQAAGFDGVQIHAAHLYLLAQFLSPHVNQRQDRWGGSTENRFRIVQQIVSRARQKVGSFPILAKFSAYTFDRNGVTEDEGVRIAELFDAAGIDALEVSCGGATDLFATMRVPRIPVEAAFAYLRELRQMSGFQRFIMKRTFPLLVKPVRPLHNYNVGIAARIKQRVSIPVIVVGGIRALSDMENIIREGQADFVAMSRPLLRTPDLIRRMEEAKETESRCIDCGHCLFRSIEHPVRCLNGKVV